MTVRFSNATPLHSFTSSLTRLWHDESGQDMVEYALVALFMGLGTVAGVHGLATSIVNDINFVVNGFANATGQ